MKPEPFYYEPRKVWLLPITHAQADDLFRDTQLWYRWQAKSPWCQDVPSEYYVNNKPSGSVCEGFALEVDAPDEEDT